MVLGIRSKLIDPCVLSIFFHKCICETEQVMECGVGALTLYDPPPILPSATAVCLTNFTSDSLTTFVYIADHIIPLRIYHVCI